jgi:diguanylate cyclase (GGDEF)-like protein
MFAPLANGLVMVGAGILAGSLLSVRQLILQLPEGRMRHGWGVLGALILVFIAGYLIYAGIFWDRHQNGFDLIVPTIFFLGACFVWLTAKLSLQTTHDVRRVVLLERESIIDAMTGVYNRRYLDRRLHEEFAKAQRHALPLSILLIDIDHFKHINDEHGHQVGDLVLIHLSKLILSNIRHSDIATRYGGEEFLIMAPNTAISAAGELAERLRQQVEAHPLKLARTDESHPQREIGMTVSIGVTTFTQEDNNSIQKLVHESDMALYRAKQGGRNRVAVYHLDFQKLNELNAGRYITP